MLSNAVHLVQGTRHVLSFIVLYCTVLCCTVLYCTVLYCTALYCTVLYSTIVLWPYARAYDCAHVQYLWNVCMKEQGYIEQKLPYKISVCIRRLCHLRFLSHLFFILHYFFSNFFRKFSYLLLHSLNLPYNINECVLRSTHALLPYLYPTSLTYSTFQISKQF